MADEKINLPINYPNYPLINQLNTANNVIYLVENVVTVNLRHV